MVVLNTFLRTFAFVLLFVAIPTAQGQVVINEFMASNKTTVADEDGDFSDWIELHNPSGTPVSINNWYLTDNAANLTKWRFPNTNVAANGYLVIFASNKNRKVSGEPLHTSWALSAGGEYLGLVLADGQTVVSEYAPTFPEQYDDVSYGLLNGTNVYFGTPTPGAANSTNSVAFVADTKFSHKRGFYDAPFNLAITTATADAMIRYTTNGSPPALTNGFTYSGPLPINRTTALRAAAFKSGFEPSNVDTQTYIFLDDVILQSTNSALASGFPATWGNHRVDYGMDPRVVTNALYSGTIRDDLKSIPTVSIVMKMEDLFSPTTGFYANSTQTGRAWERPTSIELIHPDGTEGFQVEAGIRIRGAFSTSLLNPKHSFRLFFRGEYGDSKLNYPLFGDSGTDTFDGLDIVSAQNWTWHIHAFANAGTNALYVRDQFARDTQLAMGHHAERGRYAHVYINGQYWGLYCPSERPEASYAASYFGGSKEDYDVIKSTGPSNYDIEATDGDMDAWTMLWQMATNGFSSDTAYQRAQGNNPDGSRNLAYPVLLDADNLIDYQLTAIYVGSRDGPVVADGQRPNNWFGIYRRDGSAGFKFFVHDFEHSLWILNDDRSGYYTAGTPGTGGGLMKSSPQYIWQQLRQNVNFRMRVADRAHRYFFNGGLLTPESALARFQERTNQIHRALVAESARWGDAQRSTPYTRNANWMPLVNAAQTNYFPFRSGIVLNQLKNQSLYPFLVAPSFNQHGGNVTNAFQVAISAPAGTIYYTLDGSDPRLPGNAISPSARFYSAPITLLENCTLKSRVFNGFSWSALNEASFVIIRDFTELLVTEIMYHPPNEGVVNGNEFEFIEFKNVAATDLDISGVHFTSGIQFTFPNGTTIGSGEFVVLVSNPTAFASKYPGVQIGGVYSGKLSNSGETVTLVHAAGAPLVSVSYSDSAPWPGVADGHGFSLVPQNANLNPNPNNAVNWRASANIGGSPGADDPTPNVPAVVINEILSHTDFPVVDAIELYNPTASAADVSYWFLTDKRTVPFKFRIPASTVIPAGGYIVFTGHDFNANPGSPTSFLFSSHGEEAYLFSANVSSNLTGHSHGFSFGASANGVSFGRYITSTGEAKYPAQIATTFGSANAGPRIGPVVINEIRYRPLPGDEPFIELKNITGSPVKLYDPAFPTNRWKLNGVGFTFPGNIEVPANGLVLLISGNPAAFRSNNNVPVDVPIFGPWSGVLQSAGELLQLQKPDAPDLVDGNVVVPYITVDDVRYSDRAPWPVPAAQMGSSLERINAAAYGNDPINWKARLHGATPGYDNDRNLPPFVDAGDDLLFLSESFPLSTSLNGTILDDGPIEALSILWDMVSGTGAVTFSPTDAAVTTATFPGAGTYVLRLTATDGEFTTNDTVQVTIDRPNYPVTCIASNSVWKYLDNGSDQGTAWRALQFNDSSWASGPAKLGYGEGNEATVISFGPSSSNKYITSYYRRNFEVSEPASILSLTVKLLRDDGAIVYLNGTEVFRSNMPEGPVDYLTRAVNVVSEPEESMFFSQAVNSALLIAGTNLIAVELHQVNPNGTDAGFDLELGGISSGTNQAPIVHAGTNFTITLPQDALLHGTVLDDGLPAVPGILSIAWSTISGPGIVQFGNSNSTETVARFSQSGTYTLRLTANDGAATTFNEVTVNVLPETYQSWANTHFSSVEINDPNIGAANADPDGDGFTNEEEFIAGTDPRDEQSFLRFESIAAGEETIALQIAVPPRRSYSVLHKNDLSSGSWIKLIDLTEELDRRMVEVLDQSTNAPRFFRIVAPAQP
ncbi:MAG: lamin tail domain-containing protein [Verrucomicrobia bacterium]|nr:lamin tail domain-containing protein [Verrucomicrobiota bacterium]